jgi:hypothetical protein
MTSHFRFLLRSAPYGATACCKSTSAARSTEQELDQPKAPSKGEKSDISEEELVAKVTLILSGNNQPVANPTGIDRHFPQTDVVRFLQTSERFLSHCELHWLEADNRGQRREPQA